MKFYGIVSYLPIFFSLNIQVYILILNEIKRKNNSGKMEAYTNLTNFNFNQKMVNLNKYFIGSVVEFKYNKYPSSLFQQLFIITKQNKKKFENK